jgi:hypothetical protein
MPEPVLHAQSQILCTHGGTGTVAPGQVRVLVEGSPALTITDEVLVAGCPATHAGVGHAGETGHKYVFQIAPAPCTKITFGVGAARVRVAGNPVVLQMSSAPLCHPAGSPATVPGGSVRVMAT